MNVTQQVDEIRSFCRANANEQEARRYTRFFTEGYDPYGLTSDTIHAQAKAWMEAWGDGHGLEKYLDIGDRLFESGKYEEGSFAILFVKRLKKGYSPETFERVGRWLDRGVRNWAHVDIICGDILSACLQQGIVHLNALATWRQSGSKWKRRAVPVTMLVCLKMECDIRELIGFLRPLMLDPERVVQQGLGWFLREAWKKEPGAVEEYLLEYKDSAPRLIFQYATEKMTPDHKQQFRRERKQGAKKQ